MDVPGTTIRFARPEDATLILAFINELAAHEKLGHEVAATEELLREWLFVRKTAEALIAECQGEPVGFALFFHNFSTFLGKGGIYPRERCRSLGIGKALLKKLAAIAVDRQCGRLEWWCLDWNTRSIGFYLSLGAEAMNDWTVYRISGETLPELAR